MQATLTAVVVGPPGSEIHVDGMGRIKVQFHWDRAGKQDHHSSCWIRTMQPWGGVGWGVQFIPRVGMEVVVTFEGGDPDRPMVLGSIYNATHPSPFPLPAAKTRSGWRTQSSPGGHGYNELSFDDAAANEQIYIHAQKNLDEVIENNHTVQVNKDELIRVLGNRLDTIEKKLEEHVMGDHVSRVDGNRVDVVTGNADHRVSGTLFTRVEGRERRDVQGATDLAYGGDITVRALGSSTTIVGKTDAKRSWVTHAEGTASLTGVDRVEISSESELFFTVGKSSIRVTKDRIELSSPAIVTTGESGELTVDKGGLSLKSSDTRIVMADRLLMNSSGASVMMGKEVKIDGSRILLNAPQRATEAPPPPPEPPTKIVLVDQDGSAVPHQRFIVRLPNGAEIGGKTDEAGTAEVKLLESGDIVFPDITMANEPTTGDAMPYVVRRGDYLAKLAFVHGFDADKVWNDGKNAELKKKRTSPNILHPGDLVHFPRAKRAGMKLRKGTSNGYVANLPKTTVRIRFGNKQGPYKNEAFRVEGLGLPQEGTTDGDGMLTLQVPVHVREVQVFFPKRNVVFPVRVGDMDPVDELTGARKRLEQLGYRTRSSEDLSASHAERRDRRAIKAFQRAQGIKATGIMDDATTEALVRAHGS